MSERPWVVIGNPENRRVGLFQAALAAHGLPPARVLAYLDLLTGIRSIEEVPAGAIVRIESPGENFEVEKRLLAAGQPLAESEGSPIISHRAIDRLPFDPGRILWPRQWYLGYCRILRQWHEHLAELGGIRFTSWPPDIEQMFDKVSCHGLFRGAGLPVAEGLGPVGCFDELTARMDAIGISRVFVKLAHGSSASGVVAFHRQGNRMAAITSAEMEVGPQGESRYYNSTKPRRYTRPEEIGPLINWLASHRVHVERWLPKASLAGRTCDVRVLVINGRPQHRVARTSRGPLTNLHLGNRRGDTDALFAQLAPGPREALDDTCRRAAQLFPRSLHLGLDLLFTPGFRSHFVLEANAFGDLLPRLLCDGRDTYSAQIAAVAARHQHPAGTSP